MHAAQYKYTFSASVDIADVEATVTLAVLATESLHGESRVQLETRHTFDAKSRQCVIDATTEVGRDLNQLFLGFMNREFGQHAFRVESVRKTAPAA